MTWTKSTRSFNRRHPGEEMRLSMRVVEEAGNNLDRVLRSVNSSKNGLTENDALARLKKDGKNVVSHEKPLTWYLQLLKAFNNPFVYILMGLAVVSYLTQDINSHLAPRKIDVLSTLSTKPKAPILLRKANKIYVTLLRCF